jgi:hypothetical protein
MEQARAGLARKECTLAGIAWPGVSSWMATGSASTLRRDALLGHDGHLPFIGTALDKS